MENILDLSIGKSDRTVTIKNIEEVTIEVRGKPSSKAVFKVEQADGKEFNISDVWVETMKGEKKIQGLWLNLDEDGQLSATSTLAKFLAYNHHSNLKEFIGTTVEVYPDPNNFLVFAACAINTPIPPVAKQLNLFD
ncbi:MAG: hypothetical protein H8E12_17040 [Rhodobacteraceae bacterium]|nr:hypothetical protein [Paracoccaceae bacterium]